jgi:hypothetical protein
VWNINSVESVALEYSRYNYNATNFYTDQPFRASDHDPLVVGIDDQPPAPADLTVTASPDKLKTKKPWSVTVTVTGDGQPATGDVDVYDGDRLLGTGHLVDGTVTIAMPPYSQHEKGDHTLTVRYEGSDTVAGGEKQVTLHFQ